MELQPNIHTLEDIGNQKTLAFENYLITRMDKAQNKCLIVKWMKLKDSSDSAM